MINTYPFLHRHKLFNNIKTRDDLVGEISSNSLIERNNRGFICIGTMDGQISDNFTDKFIKLTCSQCARIELKDNNDF